MVTSLYDIQQKFSISPFLLNTYRIRSNEQCYKFHLSLFFRSDMAYWIGVVYKLPNTIIKWRSLNVTTSCLFFPTRTSYRRVITSVIYPLNLHGLFFYIDTPRKCHDICHSNIIRWHCDLRMEWHHLRVEIRAQSRFARRMKDFFSPDGSSGVWSTLIPSTACN